jgi:metalloendopeptidase OMA1, mitochondrial
MKTTRRLSFVLTALLGLGGVVCARPVAAAGFPIVISEAQEAEMGRQAWVDVLANNTKTTNKARRNRVGKILKRLEGKLSPKRTFTFEVFEAPEVNAFALPGGYIGVNTAIMDLAKTDGQLAAVLAHEIIHVTQRHAVKQQSKAILAILGVQWARKKLDQTIDPSTMDQLQNVLGLGGEGIGLAFSRSYESEADHLGLLLMARARFDPNDAVAFWKRMEANTTSNGIPEILSTHPSDGNRAESLAEALPEALALYRAS